MNPTMTIREAREISRREVRDALRAHAKGETGTVLALFTTYSKCKTLPGQHIVYVPTGQKVIA